jgi:ubiquinone/menaquinone biosynthesis C-methylase UbiE
MATAAFDRVADRYDSDFTATPAARLLRQRVWRHLAAFTSGERVLELGCGTGEDALWLAERCVSVMATDVSEAMLMRARQKAAGHPLVSFERQDANALSVKGQFDGAYANFGVLNCVADRRGLGQRLGQVLGPGSRFVAVVMPPFCLWETVWHLVHGDAARATRRWRPAIAHLGEGRQQVWYPSARRLRRELEPWFRQRHIEGLGRRLSAIPMSYLWADHYVMVLERQ